MLSDVKCDFFVFFSHLFALYVLLLGSSNWFNWRHVVDYVRSAVDDLPGIYGDAACAGIKDLCILLRSLWQVYRRCLDRY